MKATQIGETLSALYETKRPLYLWGPPGVGKSACFRQAADTLDVDFLDIRGLLHDPSDLKFPMPDLEKKTIHWVNSIFPRSPEWKGIIVLEELALCPPLMQGAFLQVTWDRKIGDYQLPDGAWICAASNRQEDRAGAGRIITPLLNRFIHLDLEVSNEDWQAWAVAAAIAPEVRAFLNYRPALLHQFDPTTNPRAFPSPRSWEMLSQVLPATPPNLLHPISAGTVGEGPAAEFTGFVRIYRDLPDLNAVLANPKGTAIPKDPAILYALCGALTEKVRKGDQQTLKAFMEYVGRFPTEFSVLAFRDAAAINDKMFLLPEGARWLAANKSVLLGK